LFYFFFFQAEDGIRDFHVTGVQTCALPISPSERGLGRRLPRRSGSVRHDPRSEPTRQVVGRGSGRQGVETVGKRDVMEARDWDEKYREKPLLWSAEPNRFVEEEVSRLEPGSALDLA